MKLISIIIPVYNAENTISHCLDSVLKQSFKNFEVICIDDGSKDNSLNILKKYQKKDKRIIVYHQENIGVAKTRNKGINLAQGEYITFIDNDDYIDENYLEIYYNKIEKESLDMVIGGYRRELKEKVISHETPSGTTWSKYVIVTPWAKMFKKSTIKKYKAEFLDYKIAEDIYFLLNLYSQNIKIGYINNTGYCWYFNNKSVSNTSQRGFSPSIDILYVTNLFLKYEKNNPEKELLHYFIYRYCIWYLLFSGKYATSDKFYQEYKRIFNWLKDNKLDKVKVVKDEYIKYKIIVNIMKIMTKANLIKPFSKIYCKGK